MHRFARIVLAGLSTGALVAPVMAQADPDTWTIDANHTAAHFAVRHLLVSTVRGQFEKVSGTIRFDGEDLKTLAVQVSIDVASVNTGVAMRDNDLRSGNFFEVSKYPSISFVSTRAEPAGPGRFKLRGDLTIRGVTRQVVLEVEGPSPPVMQGQLQRTGATATTRINRRDFGLLYGRLVEGAAVVGDEVTITIDLEAVRPAP